MNCTQRPAAFYVWHTETYLWKPGDLLPLCFEHAQVIAARIRKGHLKSSDLIDHITDFDQRAFCSWELAWPLTDDFAVIEQEQTTIFS